MKFAQPHYWWVSNNIAILSKQHLELNNRVFHCCDNTLLIYSTWAESRNLSGKLSWFDYMHQIEIVLRSFILNTVLIFNWILWLLTDKLLQHAKMNRSLTYYCRKDVFFVFYYLIFYSTRQWKFHFIIVSNEMRLYV